MIKLHGSHLKTLEEDIYGGPSHVDSLLIMNPSLSHTFAFK